MWMWERIPVGRPDFKNPLMANPWGNHDGLHDDDPYRRPTLAYYWEQVTIYIESSHVRYKCYMNKLDTLTAEQVLRSSMRQNLVKNEIYVANNVSLCFAGILVALYGRS